MNLYIISAVPIYKIPQFLHSVRGPSPKQRPNEKLIGPKPSLSPSSMTFQLQRPVLDLPTHLPGIETQGGKTQPSHIIPPPPHRTWKPMPYHRRQHICSTTPPLTKSQLQTRTTVHFLHSNQAEKHQYHSPEQSPPHHPWARRGCYYHYHALLHCKPRGLQISLCCIYAQRTEKARPRPPWAVSFQSSCACLSV
jgi:hypothetical protein